MAAKAIKGIIECMGRISFLKYGWWKVVHVNMLCFVGMPKHMLDIGIHGSLHMSGIEEVIITYILCQGVQRCLIPNNHESLVHALTKLSER
jgi:hypothetical protein